MASDDNDDIALAAVGFFAGLGMFWKGFRDLKLKRTIEGLATSKVRSMAMGTVELCGRAELLSPILDPIYGQPCAYYRIEAQELRGSGKSQKWVTIYQSDSAAHPFLLADDTGRVPVLPDGPILYCRHDVEVAQRWVFFPSAGPDGKVNDFLRSLPGRTSADIRMTAQIIREGDPVYVLGYASPLDKPLTLTEKAVRRVRHSLHDVARMLKGNAELMRKADANQDGVVDAQEWDTALARLRNELERRALKEDLLGARPAQASCASALVRRSPEGLLVLSDRPEKELMSHLSSAAFNQIIGGPVLTVGCAAYLAHRLNLL